METPSMQREVIHFLLPITVFTIILSYPYWPPGPSLQNLSHPLLNSLPSLLDRKFMFLLCNVILIFLSGDSLLVIKELPYSKKRLDVYDGYMIKKNHELNLIQVSNMVDGLKFSATKMGIQITGADVKEKKENEAETENEGRVAAGRREEEFAPDELEIDEEEHFKEEDRRFDEFIARRYETWRREQQQQLNSKA